MLAKVLTGAVVGLDGALVEVDIAQGVLPKFPIVGLPDAAVKEARERVRAAIGNSGLSFPMGQIAVNLAPANLRLDRATTCPSRRGSCSPQANSRQVPQACCKWASRASTGHCAT